MARILLAEDDESLRAFLTVNLRRAGHEVESFADGDSAWAALERGAYELLLTDIVMPGMDGIELAQRAVQIRPGLKVMFITGFAAMTMESGNPALKNTRVLSKPFHLNYLVEQVETLLS